MHTVAVALQWLSCIIGGFSALCIGAHSFKSKFCCLSLGNLGMIGVLSIYACEYGNIFKSGLIIYFFDWFGNATHCAALRKHFAFFTNR